MHTRLFIRLLSHTFILKFTFFFILQIKRFLYFCYHVSV